MSSTRTVFWFSVSNTSANRFGRKQTWSLLVPGVLVPRLGSRGRGPPGGPSHCPPSLSMVPPRGWRRPEEVARGPHVLLTPFSRSPRWRYNVSVKSALKASAWWAPGPSAVAMPLSEGGDGDSWWPPASTSRDTDGLIERGPWTCRVARPKAAWPGSLQARADGKARAAPGHTAISVADAAFPGLPRPRVPAPPQA